MNSDQSTMIDSEAYDETTNVLVIREDTVNVQYLQIDENSLQLKQNHAIHTQIRVHCKCIHL